MEQAQVENLLNEIGLTPPNELETTLVTQAEGGLFEEAAKTKNSVFFNLFFDLIREPYRLFRDAVGAMLPQLFINTATGTWLEQFAADYDLERVLGVKAKHQVLRYKVLCQVLVLHYMVFPLCYIFLILRCKIFRCTRYAILIWSSINNLNACEVSMSWRCWCLPFECCCFPWVIRINFFTKKWAK